jgi:hypothetical protein
MRSVLVPVIAVVACGNREPAAHEQPPPVVAPVVRAPADAVPALDAAPPAKPAATLPNKLGWLDSPAWPAGDTLDATWLIYPIPAGAHDPETIRAPMQLVLAIAGVERVVDFPPQLGALKPSMLQACSSDRVLAPRELAKITFEEGGFGGGLVRRMGPDSVEVVAWDVSDAPCGRRDHPVPCPQHQVPLARLHTPAKAKLHELAFSVDEAGQRHPVGCDD